MARHLRVEYPGAIYHVTVRGNARAAIFLDDRDRERLLKRLSEAVEDFDIRLYLFCLMSNHLHLVVETPQANLSRFMQSLLTGYSVYFNLRHNRSGHLTHGPYGARVVDGDEYLLALTRYVHQNPVWIKGVKDRPLKERIRELRKYRWSSYRSYVGLEKRLEFVEYGPALAQIGGGSRGRQEKRYSRFVESGLAERDEDLVEVLQASSRCIGGEGFRTRVDELHAGLMKKQKRPEDVSFRRVGRRLDRGQILNVLSEVLGVEEPAILCRRRDSMLRPIVARMLCRYGGATQREVAELLGLRTGAAVSCQLRKLGESEMEEGREGQRLRRMLEQVDDRLRRLCGECR